MCPSRVVLAALPSFAATMLFAVSPAPVRAQAVHSTRPVSVVVSGGATVPTGSFKDYHDLGLHADVSVLVNVGGFRIRPELTFNRFALADKLKQLGALAAVVPGDRTFSSASTVAAVDYSSAAASTLFGAFGNVELPLAGGLYLLAGVGMVGVSSEATVTGQSFDATKLSYNGGAGFRFAIGPIAGFIEGRVAGLSVGSGNALFKDVRTVPVTFGLAF
ncbi:MAG TPA: hypothetical protein VFV33_11400 [Gemmatimonadaceae bacterium]|nr:hypothetical protein [Gemmatimonadaceae bacterium]